VTPWDRDEVSERKMAGGIEFDADLARESQQPQYHVHPRDQGSVKIGLCSGIDGDA